MLTRKKVIQAKVEATKGTEESAGFSDGVVYDPLINPASEFEPRRGSGKYVGNAHPGVVQKRKGTFTCKTELRGNGTNAMDPFVSAMLQACWLKNTAETYQVNSDAANQKTVTIPVFEDGIKKVLYGAMGNVSIEAETGKRLMCNFEMQGLYKTVSDISLPSFSPNTNMPPLFASATFTIGGVAKRISRFSLNFNNDVQPLHDPAGLGGDKYYHIVDNDPTLEFDLEAELVATYDIFGIWLAGTEAAVSIVVGSGAGKQITITIPKLQYREIPEGDRDGLQVCEAVGQCNHSSGDDAVAIAVATA